MSTTPLSHSKHVLFVTIPAYGHIIPILELAKKVSHFHAVTFAASAYRLNEIKQRDELMNGADAISFYGILDGIAGDVEDPTDAAAWERFMEAVNASFRVILSTFLAGEQGEKSTSLKAPEVVIVDSFFGVPENMTLPYYLFNAANSKMWQFIIAINDEASTASDVEVPFMRIQPPGAPLLPVQAADKMMFLPVSKTVNLATGLITASLRDIDADSLNEIEKHPSMSGVKVHCVGPLLPAEQKIVNSKYDETEKKIGLWLNGQETNSVVFISFGTMATPAKEQIKVIGQSLQLLGKPFIWALREKHHESLPDEIKDQISHQFEAKNCKFLVLPWAPQKLILAHHSVGVFLSHCGWNSTLEGLSSGKPFVAWPMFGDQLLNAEWTAELGASVLIPETGVMGPRLVPAEEINQAIKVVSIAGSKYRQTAELWAEKLGNAWTPESGQSYREFMDLIKFANI